MGLADTIRNYFAEHPRAKKALGVATAIATNFAMIASGSPLLAIAAGTILTHQDEKDKVRSGEMMDFFKEAIQDPEVRDSLKLAVEEGDINVASNVSVALNQLGAARPETGQFVDTMKSELTVVLQQMGIIREMLSYYEVPDSYDRVRNVWRLPFYIDDVIVIDPSLRTVLDVAIGHIKEDKNVVILGAPGSGKTTALYAIWKELDEESDTALVWDTKDVSRIHEKSGVILFNDDIPETRELMKAIVERDVHGIVTTAREQEWSRLPVELREKFTSISLPMVSDEVMKQIALKHLESQNIGFNKKALELLVANARGSPIYIRYMVEELGIEAKIDPSTKLTETRVKSAPKGMSDYVAGILARILFDLEGTIYRPRQGALPVIKTLLCLADMPNYETHEVHINQVFFKVKAPTDAPGPFNAIKQYLARDPRFFSLKFMHDTLADVLRGRVDHPIVGDIRMLAQEMGAAGRRNIEKEALSDGWTHVKDEYEIDSAGGLEPLLAYGYFAAKNFGIEYLDRIVVDLANEHIENPLSQGLFAITGPNIDQVVQSSIPAKSGIAEAEAVATKSGTIEKTQEPRSEVADTTIKDIEKGFKELEKIKDVMPGIGDTISKYVEGKLAGIDSVSITTTRNRFAILEEMLQQESINPTRLARAVRKTATKMIALQKSGKLKEPGEKGQLLTQAAERLVLLDSMEYIELLPEISHALAVTLGEVSTATTITKITGEIEVKSLDDKTRNIIKKAFDTGAQRSEKMANFEGMKQFLRCKWSIFGINSKDLDFASNKFGHLMKLGRPAFALENVLDLGRGFDNNQIEYKLGIALQAFKNLSGASITEREEFNGVIAVSQEIFHETITSVKSEQLLSKNETAATLCTNLLSSIVSLMDRIVKKSGKSVAPKAVYPLLHEVMKPLFLNVFEVLEIINLPKSKKAVSSIIGKIQGESNHKNELMKGIESLK